jgi:exosome complex RNA-binding protein Csl4
MFATGMKNMTPSLVTPGTQVSTSSECEAGDGTIEVNGSILATATGMFSIQDGIAIVAAQKEIVTPEVGDTVLCEIVKLNEKNGEAQVLCIEGKPGSVLPEHLYGQFHDEMSVEQKSKKHLQFYASVSETVMTAAYSMQSAHHAVTYWLLILTATGTSDAQHAITNLIEPLPTTTAQAGLR